MSKFPASALILDDDPGVAATMARLTDSVGVCARISHTADEFFHAFKDLPADVAIIDLQMPGRDGLDVIRNLETAGCTHVILCSGCDERVLDAARHCALNSGLIVLGTIQKPVRRSDLQKLLGSVHAPVKGHGRTAPADFSKLGHRGSLADAIRDRHIVPFYQPKMRLCDHQIEGFEALARWVHPDLGPIPPSAFLPTAEAQGLVRQLTELVVLQAVDFLANQCPSDMTVAINVPLGICSDASFKDFLRHTVSSHGVAPARLTVEITEAGPMELSQDQIDSLTRLRLEGFGLSIDDFGTGVSTLERLVRIPFNELKIDRYFTRELEKSRGSQELVRSLIKIAKDMGMSIVIEGIENAETLRLSEQFGCDVAQGFHIAEPMSQSKVLEWLSDRSDRA